MIKKSACLAMLFFFIFQGVAAQAATLSYNGYFETDDQGYSTFIQKYPDLQLKKDEKRYETDTEIVTAILTKEFENDMFEADTMYYRWSSLINKGFCLDLSNSDVIVQAVNRMWPKVAEQCRKDGKIYALPVGISFRMIRINASVWDEAGLSDFVAPQTFPELLTALDYWCDLLEEGDAPEGIRVEGMFDPAVYGKGSYVYWLASKLIDSYITQQQFMNASLDFRNDELLGLVKECQRVGTRLYQLEPDFRYYDGSGIKSLVEEDAQKMWPAKPNQLICLRLNDDAPKCIKADLDMWAVSSATEEAGLAVELLEKLITEPECERSWDYNLLFKDAEPKPNPSYERILANAQRYLQETQQQLVREDLDEVERSALEKDLARWENGWKRYNLRRKGIF